MNALISIDSILEPVNALMPAQLFGSGQIETIVASIENHVRAEDFDVTTEEGRERVKSVAYKIARSKTTLDEIGKEHVAVIKAQSGKIDAERKTLRDRLDALKEEVRKPLTNWEEAEANRISEHERILVKIIEAPAFSVNASTAAIDRRIIEVSDYAARDWQEFKDRAEAAIAEAIPALNAMFVAAEQRERDAAELTELRRLKADMEAKAEKARAEADAAQAAADAAEREEARAANAEKEKAAAVARAVAEAERRRQEQEARDALAKKTAEEAAERKRQENKRHREKVHKEIARAVNQAFDGAQFSPERLVEAITAGIIPHVHIQY